MDDKNFIKKLPKKIQSQQVGQRIREIRKELGLTMKEFGEKFNPPAADSIVSRWERGINMPNNQRLEKIAELSGHSTVYILTGKQELQDSTKMFCDKDTFEKIKEQMLILNDVQKIVKKKFLQEIKDININTLSHNDTTYLLSALDFLKTANEDEIYVINRLLEYMTEGNGKDRINKDDNDIYGYFLSSIKSFLKDFEDDSLYFYDNTNE